MSILCIILLVAVATYWVASQMCNQRVNAIAAQVAKDSVKDRV